MADEGIFGNPNAAAAKGRRAAEAAEHYGYVATWVRGAVSAATAAAGHPLVADGYEELATAANAQVERLRQHGVDAGSTLRTSAGILASTDAANTGILGAVAGRLGAGAAPDGGQ